MAGDTTADSVIWTPGESGVDSSGAAATVPGDNIAVAFGAGAPTGTPNGSPIYVNTSNNKLYIHNGSNWIMVSGHNT